MKKRIILVGKAASGKDYFKDYLVENGLKPSISHTTRPKREGEKDGETYHFVSESAFKAMIKNQSFFEYKNFNGWYYGTTKKETKKADVFIFTPSGIADLPKDFIEESLIVFFDISQEERIKRLEKRSDSDTIKRRINADWADFVNFKKYDLRVTNPAFDCWNLFKLITRLKTSLC